MKLDKKFQGMNPHRLASNPKEQRALELWAEENTGGRLFAHLMDGRHDRTGEPVEPSSLQWVVVNTVVQWLGSPVGLLFLRRLADELLEEDV